jgi:hypothetical protein
MPAEALAGLKSALGQMANDKRRQEALAWAFQVWRAGSGARLEEELQKAGLHVPTLSGRHPAGECALSSSLRSVGRILENYLIEAADNSPDCRRVRDLLLVGQQNWPVSPPVAGIGTSLNICEICFTSSYRLHDESPKARSSAFYSRLS